MIAKWMVLMVIYMGDVPIYTDTNFLDPRFVQTREDCEKALDRGRKIETDDGSTFHVECVPVPPAPPQPKAKPKGDPATEKRS